MATYSQVLSALYRRSNVGIKLDLDCMRALLQALGNPQATLRCVVVAGTNGKGSTSALVASALRHAGQRVGLYTSPHLLRFTERIRIDGQEIAPDTVVSLAARIAVVEGSCPRQPTFFEYVTAMGLLAFHDAKVDVAVIEVGLGGRLDATNVVTKELVVLTPIDFDHQDYLGHTLTAIAGEKAAVIEAHRPVVVAPQRPAAMAVIKKVARARHAALHPVAVQAPIGRALGTYQQINIATARTAATLLGCPAAAFDAAVADFVWPGRYQWIAGTPPILLDGAHNPAGVRALVQALDNDTRLRGRPLHGVFSALQNKDATAMLALLGPRLAALHLCPVTSTRTRSPAQLQALAPTATVHADVDQALAAARRGAGPDGAVVVLGSLFLVADALASLTGELRDPPVDG